MAFNDIDRITEREVTKDFVERLSIGKDFANPDYNNLNSENNILFNAETKLKDTILAKTIMGLPSDYINNISNTKTSYIECKAGATKPRIYVPQDCSLYKVIHENTGFNVRNTFSLLYTNKHTPNDFNFDATLDGSTIEVSTDLDNGLIYPGDVVRLRFKNGYSVISNIIDIVIYFNNRSSLICPSISNALSLPSNLKSNYLLKFEVIDLSTFKFIGFYEDSNFTVTKRNNFIDNNVSQIKPITITEDSNATSSAIKANIDSWPSGTLYSITLKTNKTLYPSIVSSANNKKYVLNNNLNDSLYKAGSVIKVFNDNGKYIVVNDYNIYQATLDSGLSNSDNIFKAYFTHI